MKKPYLVLFLVALLVTLWELWIAKPLYASSSNTTILLEVTDGSVSSTPTPTSGTTSISNAAPPVCNDIKPASAPWLYGASAKSNSSILLQFTQANEPVSEYVLEYGTEPGNYKFAMSNIGGKGTTSYVVASLSPNTTYYFRVRAGNGCSAGSWSNELSAKTLSRFSFLTGKELETEITETDTRKSEKEKQEEESIEEKQEEETSGVSVRIKVVDEKKNPVEGAKVTLYSTPRESLTDEKGTAIFDKVEPGEHRVVIAYKGQIGEQTINIQDTGVEEIDFTIQIKSVSSFKDPKVLGVIGALAVSLIAAIAIILKRR